MKEYMRKSKKAKRSKYSRTFDAAARNRQFDNIRNTFPSVRDILLHNNQQIVISNYCYK